MTLEFQNQISIQPTESGGGDTPTGRDVGVMYQSASVDGTTWSGYSELTTNTVAELAMLKPFSSDYTGLSGLVTGNKKLTTTLTFKYVKDTTSLNGNLLYMTMTDNGYSYSQGIKIAKKQLALPTAGTKNVELVVGNTYTVKLVFNNSTKSYSLYYKIVGQDTDFTLLEEVTRSMSTSSNNNYIMIMNTCSNNKATAEYFHCADFDLSDITIDIDGEVIFSRAKSSGGGGGSDFIGIPRELNNGVLQMPSGSYSLPSGVTTIDDYALYYAFYQASGLSNVNLSGLTTVNPSGLYMAFREAGLTDISFPNLVTIEERGCSNVCNRCTSLTSVSFPELTTVKLRGLENAFYNCTGLTSVTFDKLSNIGADYALSCCFTGCKSLTDVYLPALTTNSFGSSTNQFSSWLESVTNPKVHLPSNLSSVSGLTDKIQSNNGTVQVFYDLPATS